jgi:ferredoxin
MTRCPVGSIRRKETLDIVIEDWCIGCSNCATDCPYGNINVTLIADSNDKKAEPRPKAVVCDLCADYGEPNCVRACPHDAAIRVEPKSFFAQGLAGQTLAVAAQPAAAPAAASSASAAPQPAPASPGAPAPAPATPVHVETQVLSNISELLALMPRLRAISGERAGNTLQLRYPETSFGRSAEADYRFADDEKISRIHCKIVAEHSRYIVRDNSSTNGTFVNGNQISEVELRAGDTIRIGAQEFEFLGGQS